MRDIRRITGAEQKVAIADDVVLDFTELFRPLITLKEAEKGPKNDSLLLGNEYKIILIKKRS